MKRESNRSHVPIQSHPPKGGSRRTGQGMVEFALALPILLMVMYGLLEAGRLIFIYASTITAARSAVRYGSATGENAGNIPFYRDCDGIDNEVRRLGFINTFDDINVTYDRGLDTSGKVVAIPGIDSNPTADTCPSMNDNTLRNGDRIKVQVVTQWSPIIAIVPSWQGFTITSSSERTIIMEVPIGIDPESEVYVPGGALKLTVTTNPPVSYFNAPGQTIYYSYTVVNNATFNLNAPFRVLDTIVTNWSCPATPNKLAPGASLTCTGSYVTTQADLDTGYITNLAVVRSLEASSNQTGITIPAIQNKALILTKSASPILAVDPGTVITYTYKFTNSGNVTLTGPYSVTDNKIPSEQINCSGASAVIAPGTSTQCTATYIISDTDIVNRAVTNTASARAFFRGFEVVSNTTSAKVNTSPLDLKVTASPLTVTSLNQKIAYAYTIKNVGSTTLLAPFAISDDRAVNLSCSSSSSIPPGGTIPCTGEYFVTQADLDFGDTLINRATATSNGGSIQSNMDFAKVEVSPPVSLSLVINPIVPPGAVKVGTIITYNYVITNTGSAALAPAFSITELNLPGANPICPLNANLAPLATTTCTLNYTVIQSDLDKGLIYNLAVAKAFYKNLPVISAQSTAIVPTFSGAHLSLAISSNPVNFQLAGQTLNITFTLINSGNVSLYPPYQVNAGTLGTVNCSNITTSIAPGQQATCSQISYITSQTDLEIGKVAVSGTATAKDPSGNTVTSGVSSFEIPSNFQCFVYHRLTFTPPPSITFPRVNQLAMSIISDPATSAKITIKSVELSNWNYASNPLQYITSVAFGGSQIATGGSSKRVNPVTFSSPYTGDPTILPGISKVLLFTFNENYGPTGNERIKVTFLEHGCPVLDSSDGTQVK